MFFAANADAFTAVGARSFFAGADVPSAVSALRLMPSAGFSAANADAFNAIVSAFRVVPSAGCSTATADAFTGVGAGFFCDGASVNSAASAENSGDSATCG